MTRTQPQDTRIALVTGASRGLGRSMAEQLAQRGVDVILTYRSGERAAREVAQSIVAMGRKAVALPLNVADGASFEAFAKTVATALQRTWGRDRFDYLVNNAGSGFAATSFSETTAAQFDELYQVHLRGPFFLTQTLLPLIADGGSIVNVSSGLARYTFPGFSVYAAMKGGVEVLTRYLAKELGPRGITVNVIAPGGVATDFAGGAMLDPELQKIVSAQTALGRVAVADDIGGAVAALLSPECRWITGQRVEATGGFSL